ncbi:hypothetical protein [Cognataquiflexum rubidum]|uniref:hypothetical protein n=1 Tax=Cognataquiflexum rubidum TaxID=2922273 RepID=UPI001F12AE40|nr:hypothetical protein [Cognataquiflexum rubidum]MCH6233233.1 hypothetical protein [Cognataquiflexum rubidum]
MKVTKLVEWVLLIPVNLIAWLLLIIIGLGNIAVIVVIFLLAPLSILNLIRKIFPETGQEVVIRFFFSWYDLVFYLPGAALSYFLIVKLVYPFSKMAFLNFVIWPMKDFFKKQ